MKKHKKKWYLFKSEKRPTTINLTDAEWLWLLFAWGESQISHTFENSKSELLSEVEKYRLKFKPTALKEDQKIFIRNFKTNFFDRNKGVSKVVQNKLSDGYQKSDSIKAISLWKPVWNYLISQIDYLYTFKEEALMIVPKEEIIVHDVYERVDIPYSLEGTVRVPKKRRLLNISEEEGEKQLHVLKNIITSLLVLIPIFLSIIVFINVILGVVLSGITLMITGIIFITRNIVSKKIFFFYKRDIFKILFPEKKMVSNYLGNSYSSNNFSPARVAINIFFEEQNGIRNHRRLLRKDLHPCYIQDVKYISLCLKNGNNKQEIVHKTSSKDPLLFFEENDVIIIPYDAKENNHIIGILKNVINIEELDIPKIIYEGIQTKL